MWWKNMTTLSKDVIGLVLETYAATLICLTTNHLPRNLEITWNKSENGKSWGKVIKYTKCGRSLRNIWVVWSSVMQLLQRAAQWQRFVWCTLWECDWIIQAVSQYLKTHWLGKVENVRPSWFMSTVLVHLLCICVIYSVPLCVCEWHSTPRLPLCDTQLVLLLLQTARQETSKLFVWPVFGWGSKAVLFRVQDHFSTSTLLWNIWMSI